MRAERLFLFLSGCFLLLTQSIPAQEPSNAAAVTFHSDTLYFIDQSIGAFSPADRAIQIGKNIRKIAKEPLSEYDSLKVAASNNGFDIHPILRPCDSHRH
jgi:hypothetical protein